jgi:hypothetical protein
LSSLAPEHDEPLALNLKITKSGGFPNAEVLFGQQCAWFCRGYSQAPKFLGSIPSSIVRAHRICANHSSSSPDASMGRAAESFCIVLCQPTSISSRIAKLIMNSSLKLIAITPMPMNPVTIFLAETRIQWLS